MCLSTNSRRDPTLSGGIRQRAIREMKRRRDRARDDLVAFTQSLEQYVTREVVEDGRVVNRVVYRYDIDPSIDVDSEIRRIVQRWFDTGANEKPNRYFMDEYVSSAYTQGGTIEAERLAGLAGNIDDMSAAQVQSLLQSPAFRDRIAIMSRRVFEDMVDFTGDAAGPLRQYLAQQIAEGKGIRTIVAGMKKEWDTQATYRLERIARTEIAQAHRGARQDMMLDARDRLGLRTKVQLISALAPTTRPSHARLHLRIVEIEEVEALYADTPGGRIQCLCSEQSVIVTEDGELLGRRSLTKRDEQEIDRIIPNG